MREARSRIVSARGGCRDCLAGIWTGKNAMAVAARHHDATGHRTYCDQVLEVRYGPAEAAGGGQIDLFEPLGEPG